VAFQAFNGIPVAIHSETRQTEGVSLQESGLTLSENSGTIRCAGEARLRSVQKLFQGRRFSRPTWACSLNGPKIFSWAPVYATCFQEQPFRGNYAFSGIGISFNCGAIDRGYYLGIEQDISFGRLGKGNTFRLMMARLGFQNAEQSFITAGLGAYLWPVAFDISYAWSTTDRNTGYYKLALKYRFGGEHFSELYLNRSVEKATMLEQRIRQLEERKNELNKSLGDSMFVPERKNRLSRLRPRSLR